MAAEVKELVAEFAFRKTTAGTVVFEEVVGEFDAPEITKSLYVPRTSIPKLGWSEGDKLEVVVRVKS